MITSWIRRPIPGARFAIAVIGAAGAVGFAAVFAAGPAGLANATPVASTNPGTMYGDPTGAAQYWRQQHSDDCGEMAVADVVGQLTGGEPSEQDIVALAEGTKSSVHGGPVYTSPTDLTSPYSGTSPADEVVLLAHYGIHAVLTSEHKAATTGVATGLDALEKYLADGRKIIVGVNAETLWGEPDGDHQHADHAVVVTGIDTKTGTVHLNDSGTPDGRDEQVPLATFQKAWAAGDDQIIVTDADQALIHHVVA